MAAGIIEKERKKLLEILQQDLDSILDSLTSRRLISEDEYEALEGIPDPLRKSRKLLILVQKKGEDSCQHFLKCLCSTFPESATTWGLMHEFLKHENIESPQSPGVSKNSEDLFSPGKEQPESSEITVSFKKKEHLEEVDTSGMLIDTESSYGEMAWSSGENEKAYNPPAATMSPSEESVESEVSGTIDYSQDQQRYDEPDESLYLGEEEDLASAEDAESNEEEGDNNPEYLDYGGEEDPVYSETAEFSGDEQSYGDSEPGMLLEEEEEEESMEERKKVFKDVLSCLNLDRSRKLLPDFVQQFSLDRGCKWTPETPGDLAWNFLVKVLALDVTARDSILRHEVLGEDGRGASPSGVENLEMRDTPAMNPLDVLCASLLCSDSSLQHAVMSSMYRCGFALPLLLPDAENNKSILMLGAMKGIVKGQPALPSEGPAGETERSLARAKMPVISFVRLGDCSFSKSRILNALLSPAQPQLHKVFLHHDLPVPVLPRQISDGLVEIAWCFPESDSLRGNPPLFPEPVAVANLHGDLESVWTQFGFLVEVSSVVFFFTDCLGEKEWDLLMFLGEDAIGRCYFILSPQARESEEAQIFQMILKLKPSQLLFWEEEEEAGEEGRNWLGLRTALQEVMSSSLRRVSVEDMASLARELGIQVDQDFENVQGIHQVVPGDNLAGTVEEEGQRRHSQPESSSESPAEVPARELGTEGEVTQALQNVHLAPVFVPYVHNLCPFPVRIGGHLNRAPVRGPRVAGFHLGSEQKSKWFRPPPFHNSRVPGQGRSFGVQYFQPQRFCPPGSFMKFSRPARGSHMVGLWGRPPRPIWRHVKTWLGRPQTPGGHFHAQPAGPAGRPSPRQAHARGTQPPEATEKQMRTSPHTVTPHPRNFQPAGVIHRPLRPAFQQGFKLKTPAGPSNPARQMGSHPTSNRFLPNSLFRQPTPSQGKHSQPRPFQPMASQPKPTQTKPTQPQPAQARCSQSKPTQPQPSHARCSPSRPTQPQPSQARCSQSKPTQPQPSHARCSQSRPTQPKPSHARPSQPRPTQPKSSGTSASQAKASYSRAGPKRGGKH
ncbi:caspase recruitment domain-containing protein 6 isoform X1 [Pipistrellus kuhlii]|uniref:Caspase recruitment domain family member 6 n=1 Tax=Pipistrellus kuhlii TaxID=59472 RepID=A0A7J7YV50_PIPKU|nr:caspase recruitment domain-containing protein 6 isoform X1 [Pipistrellus kuhlii]KAF6365881.1 caspase recruitment domain family member 6 [Pipistrellus kuhlii]